jgi:hypothetical protein
MSFTVTHFETLLFDILDYSDDDVRAYIRDEYVRLAQQIGKIIVKPDDKRKFYKKRLDWLKDELKGLLSFAAKYRIQLV